MRILHTPAAPGAGQLERAEITGTSAQLAGLGTLLLQITQNTGVKATGHAQSFPKTLPNLRLLLAAQSDEKMIIEILPEGLSLSAGREIYALLGESLVNSFSTPSPGGYSITLAYSGEAGSTVLAPTRIVLGITSEEKSKSGWFDG